jgi:calcineurin-like phosphoesterase family protein
MTTFFTSDTHFGHANILKFQPVSRPQHTVEEMDRHLIEAWQSVVKPSDRVFHLGDFAFAQEARIINILDQLPGQKFLIRGNHDHKMNSDKVCAKFGWVRDYHEDKIDGQSLTMCHFPMMVWNKSHYGAFMLHGHCHGNLRYPFAAKILDVGVDNVGFTPITMDQVKQIMARKPISLIDHHGSTETT